MKRQIIPVIVMFFLFFTLMISGCNAQTGEKNPVQNTVICPTCPPVIEQTATMVPTPTEENNSGSGSSGADSGSQLLVIYPKQVYVDNPDEYYSLELEYPFMDGNSEAAFNFNNTIDEFISEETESFINIAQDDTEFIDENFPGMKSSLYIDQSITGVIEEIISVHFNISYFIIGAAHPNHYSHSYTFDMENNQFINLSDLFLPQSDYLNILSQKCIEDLENNEYINNDSEWLKTGASPKEENFRVWNITPDGLMITFDPYQVAPYAAGFQVVVIPYTELDSVIDEDSALQELMK